MHRDSTILLTAFEQSGDAHAASVVSALKRLRPELRIHAWGGPALAAAGADIVAESCSGASMGIPSLSKIQEVRRQVRHIKEWSETHPVDIHIPVDSPAANFPLCSHMKSVGARVVHLVAPQLWAWGGWRAAKLKRRTDCLCCLLPHEEDWFESRGIPARFVGHPRINRVLDEEAIQSRVDALPAGELHIGLFPGSRAGEVRSNLPLLLDVLAGIRGPYPDAVGLVVSAGEEMDHEIRRAVGTLPEGVHLRRGDPDSGIAWSDICLAVSGTITLDIARQGKPMIGVYAMGWRGRLFVRCMLRTRWALLPNIILDRPAVPEFVGAAASIETVLASALELLGDPEAYDQQVEALGELQSRFEGCRPDEEIAGIVFSLLDHGTLPPRAAQTSNRTG